jgi:hypothetical protein
MGRKGDIGRENLLLHGISYEPDVYQAHNVSAQPEQFTLPDHVDAVREGLLVMEDMMPREWEQHLRKESVQYGTPDTSPEWMQYPQSPAFLFEEEHEAQTSPRSTEWTTVVKNAQRWERVAKRARDLLEFPEAEWSLFWRSDVFRLFNKEACTQQGFK